MRSVCFSTVGTAKAGAAGEVPSTDEVCVLYSMSCNLLVLDLCHTDFEKMQMAARHIALSFGD